MGIFDFFTGKEACDECGDSILKEAYLLAETKRLKELIDKEEKTN